MRAQTLALSLQLSLFTLTTLLVGANHAQAQTLTPITMPQNGFSAVPIFEDAFGNRYAEQITVHFGD